MKIFKNILLNTSLKEFIIALILFYLLFYGYIFCRILYSTDYSLYNFVERVQYSIINTSLDPGIMISDSVKVKIGNEYYLFGQVKKYLNDYDLKKCITNSYLRNSASLSNVEEYYNETLKKSVGWVFVKEVDRENDNESEGLEYSNEVYETFIIVFQSELSLWGPELSMIKTNKDIEFVKNWFSFCKNTNIKKQ